MPDAHLSTTAGAQVKLLRKIGPWRASLQQAGQLAGEEVDIGVAVEGGDTQEQEVRRAQMQLEQLKEQEGKPTPEPATPGPLADSTVPSQDESASPDPNAGFVAPAVAASSAPFQLQWKPQSRAVLVKLSEAELDGYHVLVLSAAVEVGSASTGHIHVVLISSPTHREITVLPECLMPAPSPAELYTRASDERERGDPFKAFEFYLEAITVSLVTACKGVAQICQLRSLNTPLPGTCA